MTTRRFDPLRPGVNFSSAETLRVAYPAPQAGRMKNLRRSARIDEIGGTILALVLVLGTLSAIPACKTTGAGGIGARIVDCATRAIQDKGMAYLGKVNDVLGNTGVTDETARARLIDLGIDAGQDVLGCLLADQAPKYAEAASHNPSDEVSKTAAARAKSRLKELQAEGWRFER